MTAKGERPVDHEVVIVGAGISGIAVGIALLAEGIRSFVLLERADALGGTWRDNTYPGVAVDIPSASYCFPFETDFPWSRAYAPGHEIQAYVAHCAEKYAVAPHIRYGCNVEATVFDAATRRWTTRLADGRTLTSRFVVAATGIFTTPKVPDFPGLADFAGPAFHTARWDHGVDLDGRRVAVVGTGASAVQIVPELAERVAALHVFQRTPVWVAPRPDRPVDPGGARRHRPVRDMLWWVSEGGIEVLTWAATHYRRAPVLVRGVEALTRRWMRSQVPPHLAERLVPDYALGCKRPATSNTYLRSFTRPNVSLVTSPIDRIAADGVCTADGRHHAADVLVLATGFLTTEEGNAPAFEVWGAGGVELGRYWEDARLQSYRGVAVPGFPSFFLTAGPYSGGFNWFTMLDAHVPQIVGCIAAARRRGTIVEVDRAAHDAWMRDMWRFADEAVFTSDACRTARSYYLDRHGDAALPLPRSPWWRQRVLRGATLRGFRFPSEAR